jgi:hypothetical protein
MPRKKRVDEGHAGFEVEMTIPVNHTRRARSMEERLGPPEPPNGPKPGSRIPRITRLMALAIKLQEMIDRGEIQDYVDIARLGYITRARASQIMNLTLLAPDIQEAILEWDGAGPNDLREQHLRPVIKLAHWGAQRAAWACFRPQRGEAATTPNVRERPLGCTIRCLQTNE